MSQTSRSNQLAETKGLEIVCVTGYDIERGTEIKAEKPNETEVK